MSQKVTPSPVRITVSICFFQDSRIKHICVVMKMLLEALWCVLCQPRPGAKALHPSWSTWTSPSFHNLYQIKWIMIIWENCKKESTQPVSSSSPLRKSVPVKLSILAHFAQALAWNALLTA